MTTPPEATLRALVDAATPDGTDALSLARDRLEAAGLDVRLHDEADALVARRGEAGLHLAGHVDVVPADATQWPVDPGTATAKDGALWGRGTVDMLGAVACFLTLAEAEPDLPLGVILTTDEETGMAGAGTLVDDGFLDAVDAVVLGEPTDLALGVAHKGVLWADVVAQGATAHASMAEAGENALRPVAEALPRLLDLDLGVDHPLLGPASVVPTGVEAGDARNQVPGEARIGVDVRFPPPLTSDDVVDRLAAALEGVDCRVEVAFAIDPFEGDADGPLAQAASEALEARGLPSEGVGLPFGTEAGRYRRLDVEQVVLGPGDPELAHTAEERVDPPDLETALEVYRDVATAWEDRTP